MPDFVDADLSGASFERTDLRGAQLHGVDMSGARLRAVDLTGVVMRGVDLVDVDIFGEVQNLVINGVDVAPLIQAELDRRHPDLVKMRPETPAGFAEAWNILESSWGDTVQRARQLRPWQLHESVDGEWSFTETLRHLAFATDSWVRRVILGDPSPWDPLDLPWDEMPDMPGVIPRDRDARPSLDTVLELRRDRMNSVRSVIGDLTDALLDSETKPADGPGWPPPGSTFTVRKCLLVILNEEWWHRQFAERDLAALAERAGQG